MRLRAECQYKRRLFIICVCSKHLPPHLDPSTLLLSHPFHFHVRNVPLNYDVWGVGAVTSSMQCILHHA